MRLAVLVVLLGLGVPVRADGDFPPPGGCSAWIEGLTLQAAVEGDATTPRISLAAADLAGPVVLLEIIEAPAAFVYAVDYYHEGDGIEGGGSYGGVGLGSGTGCMGMNYGVRSFEATLTQAGATHARLELWSAA